MYIKKLIELIVPFIQDEEKKERVLGYFEKIPSLENCSNCRTFFMEMKTNLITEFKMLPIEKKKEFLTLLNMEHEIIKIVHESDDTKLYDLIFRELDECILSDENQNEKKIFYLQNRSSKEIPKIEIIVHGKWCDVSRVIGDTFLNARAADGKPMFVATDVNFARNVALILKHEDGTPCKYTTLLDNFKKGIDPKK
jgi:hypothetical protein